MVIFHCYVSSPEGNTIRGMNIHLPAILMFTRYQGFDTLPNDERLFSDINVKHSAHH